MELELPIQRFVQHVTVSDPLRAHNQTRKEEVRLNFTHGQNNPGMLFIELAGNLLASIVYYTSNLVFCD